MFRFPLFILITLIVAFGGGIMISLYALDATQGFGAIKPDTLPLIEIAKNRKLASELVDKVGLNDGPTE